MANNGLQNSRASAVADFNRMRRQAALHEIIGRLTGRSSELLSYEQALHHLKGQESAVRTLEDIRLNAIVGSAGRYQEFTRGFLPRKYVNPQRWASVKLAMTGMTGVPPIEVYRIGEAYFVQDGNHRISVAKEMGLSTIQAYVTDVRTKVPLSPDVHPQDLILAAEQTEFLDRTRYPDLLPEANLRVTATGQYPALLEHIDVHRYFMGLEKQREIAYEEAVIHWYDVVYQPLARMIREHGLLRDFPGRTETDLYMWIGRHRSDLEQALGWEISVDAAVTDLNHRFGGKPLPPNRAGERLRNVLNVDAAELRATTPRESASTSPRADRIVDDLLVIIDGEETGWHALDLALQIAGREGARLHGLHAVASDTKRDEEHIQTVQAEFERRCRRAGVVGKLAIDSGDSVSRVCQRARWADVVVTGLGGAPSGRARVTLGIGLRALLRRCPRPVLTVPGPATQVRRVLLAYDASPKSDEALFVAIYLAGWWNVALSVISVSDTDLDAASIQVGAHKHLDERDVQAKFIRAGGRVADAIVQTARDERCDLILMGGYGLKPPLRLVLGSAVDRVLRASPTPVLVCQ